mgnify:CR=1 FL=1
MYEAYGYGADSRPSDLHSNRAKDKNGNFIGFNAERRFSENCLLQIDRNEDGSVAYGLIPIDLTMENERVLERGLPKIGRPPFLTYRKLRKIARVSKTLMRGRLRRR